MTIERFVKQLDGCTYCSGGLNCTCACHAMWMHRASQGRVSMSACGVRSETGDRTGGTTLRQMQAISMKHNIAGGTLWLPGTFDKLRDLVMTGRYGTHVNIGYNVLANTRYDCFSGNFRGAHDTFISAGDSNNARVGDPGADGRRTGIPKGWQSMPWELLERAAGALPLSTGGPTLAQEYGSGRVYAYLTPPDPIVSNQKYRVRIDGPTPIYDKPNGRRVGGVSSATYNCIRAREADGKVWYRILLNSKTTNRGRYFRASAFTHPHPY